MTTRRKKIVERTFKVEKLQNLFQTKFVFFKYCPNDELRFKIDNSSNRFYHICKLLCTGLNDKWKIDTIDESAKIIHLIMENNKLDFYLWKIQF